MDSDRSEHSEHPEHPEHSGRSGVTTDHRTAEAHRVAVALADALLALAPVDERLHRRLVDIAGALRDLWLEQVRDEALYLAHRHLEELVQIACRDLPATDDGDRVPVREDTPAPVTPEAN
ncbi:hypothetical protein, partial [Kitasatospora putterlickiae]|uniref:hypothetical protein n=1 Tax=Kitasatospora putterlickiae TaxID=221725 RepID=UPI0031D99ABD